MGTQDNSHHHTKLSIRHEGGPPLRVRVVPDEKGEDSFTRLGGSSVSPTAELAAVNLRPGYRVEITHEGDEEGWDQ